MMFSKRRRTAFLAVFGAGHIAGAAEAASPVTVHDCDALKNLQAPFVLTLRNDATTLVQGDVTTTTPPSVSRMRVLRGDDGRVTTFLMPDREGGAPIVLVLLTGAVPLAAMTFFALSARESRGDLADTAVSVALTGLPLLLPITHLALELRRAGVGRA